MKLSDGSEAIKKALPLALIGDMDVSKDDVEKIISIGFLLNHLTMRYAELELIFEFGKFKIVTSLRTIGVENVSPPGKISFDEECYFSLIIDNEIFLKALQSFKRDNKISEILGK